MKTGKPYPLLQPMIALVVAVCVSSFGQLRLHCELEENLAAFHGTEHSHSSEALHRHNHADKNHHHETSRAQNESSQSLSSQSTDDESCCKKTGPVSLGQSFQSSYSLSTSKLISFVMFSLEARIQSHFYSGQYLRVLSFTGPPPFFQSHIKTTVLRI
jgi:ABC-type nickel/cobalt efflux system permease component RcnA